MPCWFTYVVAACACVDYLLQEESLKPGAKVVFRARSDARNVTSREANDVNGGGSDDTSFSNKSFVSQMSNTSLCNLQYTYSSFIVHQNSIETHGILMHN